ncbi:hypothetical protein H8A95_28485 [Bradyrhizobium sp. Pear76]|uniref:hypothetical protein n=1 Tax=Bradyrhizobium oropedii TaxID=1571201 RepID=UPI001E643016|nr:hypothetical protein [Bradyrhizobium oropedii]MCC8966155.1 hypothetical protein [Bradyrhizobium oropedii]
MWNWISAIGVSVEFAGFVILAIEVYRTLNSDILENLEIVAEKSATDSMIVDDETDLHFGGGQIGKLIEQINARQASLRSRKNLIRIGAIISAVGCIGQIVGSFGQAWTAN